MASGRNGPQTDSMIKRPNILFILADDLGYGDLGCYGRPPADYATPNLDRLATEGIRFNFAYSAAPECTPTRCAFTTGRYPARTPIGLMEPLGFRDASVWLDSAHPTVASLLQGNGYATALIGKWHLGCAPNPGPTQYGFNEFFGILGPAVDYITHTDDSAILDLVDSLSPSVPTGYLTGLFTARAIDYIGRATRPFFLSLQYTAPHWPWEAPGDPAILPVNWTDSLVPQPRAYARMMENLDADVGRIMDALRNAGLENDTLVIFTSDNGGDRAFSNRAPLSGSKFELREGGIRVPAMVRWPAALRGGVVIDQVAITMDWTATILAATQTRADPAYPLDGVDLLGVMRPPASGRDLLCEWVHSKLPNFSTPPFIVPMPQFPRTLFWRTGSANPSMAQDGMRSGNWKYYRSAGIDYLFDLPNDPGEINNLATTHAAVLANLKTTYNALDAQMLPRP